MIGGGGGGGGHAMFGPIDMGFTDLPNVGFCIYGGSHQKAWW